MTAPDEGGFARSAAEPPAASAPHHLWSDPPDASTRSLPGAGSGAEDGGQAQATSTDRTYWDVFTAWRRSRPFWGALFSIIGGLWILLVEIAPFRVVVHIGPVGLIGYAVPILMVLCGILLWFAPHPRAFYASLILLLSLGSWVTSNLGGFIIGMILGLVGGSLALTWTDAPKTAKAPKPAVDDEPEAVARPDGEAGVHRALDEPDAASPDGATWFDQHQSRADH